MRLNAELTCATYPSWVWANETASFTLFEAPSMRAICAFNFIDTARPALSSAGEVIFEPDDRRWRDWLRFAEDCISSVDAFCADRFVLMTITNSFRESPREGAFLFCATSMLRVCHLRGGKPLIPVNSLRLLTACLATIPLSEHLARLQFQSNFFSWAGSVTDPIPQLA